jgi:hypothetical protein
LSRFWEEGPIACVIGLNPSTADDRLDDPTNRRLIGLLKAQSFGGYWLINLIPESTPYPDRLGKHTRRLSNKNQSVIHETVTNTDAVILAWGAGADRCPFRYGLVEGFIDPLCFGVTRHGEPKHPLYLPSHTKLEPFPGYRI